MKVARLHGVDDVRLDEVELPELGARDALLRIEACGICGSDLGYIKAGGLAGPSSEPMASSRRRATRSFRVSSSPFRCSFSGA